MIDKYLNYLHEYKDPNKPSLYRKIKGKALMLQFKAGMTADSIKNYGLKKTLTNTTSKKEKIKIAKRAIDKLHKKGYKETEGDADYKPAK